MLRLPYLKVGYLSAPRIGSTVAPHSDWKRSQFILNHEDLQQVENEERVKKVEDIAAVDGVDCIQMGPLDLSASMGYLWDPGNRKVREMMRKAEKAVIGSLEKDGGSGAGAFLAGFAMPFDLPEELAGRGYHTVSGAVDVGMFRSAAVEDVRRFKASLAAESSDDEDGDEKYWSE